MRRLELIHDAAAEAEKEKILLSAPHMTGNETAYIQEAFETNWIAPLGPNVDAFEHEMEAYLGTSRCLTVSSGTAAIHLALRLLEVGPGDRVFCSTLTFVASANPILYQGAEPVFIDSEDETWNMSPAALRKAFDAAVREVRLPKAVIIVHLYGQSAKMDELLAICDEYGVPVVEDSAESLGSVYKGKKSGTMGRFGIYSFNGNKIITSSGGGMLVSNDSEAITRARFLATQAKEPAPFYAHREPGYNYRMSNVLAGIGRAQLQALDNRVAARKAIFRFYEKQLAGLPGVSFQHELPGTSSNRWLSVLQLDSDVTDATPDELKAALEAENIESRHVWKPLHTQELFADCAFFPHSEEEIVSERLFRNGLCLPSGSSMTRDQQQRVVEVLKKALLKKQETRPETTG